MGTSWPSPLAKDVRSIIRDPVKELLHLRKWTNWKPEGVCFVTEVGNQWRVVRTELAQKKSLFNVKKRRRRFLKAGASIYGRWISELLFVGFLPRLYVC